MPEAFPASRQRRHWTKGPYQSGLGTVRNLGMAIRARDEHDSRSGRRRDASPRVHMLEVETTPRATPRERLSDGWLPLEDVIITSQLSRRTPRDRDLVAEHL